MNKIFCVGLNETGSTSLHCALKILGFKSVHFMHKGKKNIKIIIENNYRHGRPLLSGIEI